MERRRSCGVMAVSRRNPEVSTGLKIVREFAQSWRSLAKRTSCKFMLVQTGRQVQTALEYSHCFTEDQWSYARGNLPLSSAPFREFRVPERSLFARSGVIVSGIPVSRERDR